MIIQQSPDKMEARFDAATMFAATMFALSIVLLAFSASDANVVNADIPEDVVYTDEQKTVFKGDNAVLKCDFRGMPLAVYWKKGNEPESAPSLTTWVKYLPHAGSCTEDGAVEMADDFSLILKEVDIEDESLYICLVVNYKGVLIHNVTRVMVLGESERARRVRRDIPEGVVFTDVQKSVIEGKDAVLKCDFRGTPLAVYWKKGSDPKSALNLITRVKDLPPAGSCVEDGTCEMADDFSLILKEVDIEDEGQYICLVVNYKGILIRNVTNFKVIDISDGVVYTDVRKVVTEGDNAVLKCQFPGTPLAVYWKKGNDPESAPNLITWAEGSTQAGSCTEDGACEMADDFSLILKKVEMEDQGRYICRVSNYKGILMHNFTDVKVIGSDQFNIYMYTQPYVTAWTGSSVSLPCSFRIEVQKVLWQKVYWDGGSKVETILKHTSDGHEALASGRYSWSENYGLVIRDLHASDEGKFICLISTTDGIEIKSSTVLHVNEIKTLVWTTISTSLLGVVSVFLFIMKCIRRSVNYFRRPDGRNADVKLQPAIERHLLMERERKLDDLREQLKNYQPGNATNIENTERFPRVINLGVFGAIGVGKSSLINSISFALKSTFDNVIFRVSDGGHGEVVFQDGLPLTNHINIIYNRGMQDLSERKIGNSLIPQICGERGLDSDEGVVTHCPIFVHDIREPFGPMCIFLQRFTSAVHEHYGQHVMVVFTHTNTEENLDFNISCTHTVTGIPEEYIWSFENYTENNNIEDVEKSIKYLKFLQKCLEIGEKNSHM